MRTLLNATRLISAAALLGLAAGAVVAQTRHDDKPHGKAQPAAKSTGHPAPHTSGRHSDMMHGSSSEPAKSQRSSNDAQAPASSHGAAPAATGASSAGDGTKK